MNCPICNNDEFEITGTEVFKISDDITKDIPTYRFLTAANLICCAKCHITLYIKHEDPDIPDWKYWADSNLIWNEERQRLESSPSKRQTMVLVDSEARIDTIKKDIASLSPEAIGELLEMFNRKEEE